MTWVKVQKMGLWKRCRYQGREEKTGLCVGWRAGKVEVSAINFLGICFGRLNVWFHESFIDVDQGTIGIVGISNTEASVLGH